MINKSIVKEEKIIEAEILEAEGLEKKSKTRLETADNTIEKLKQQLEEAKKRKKQYQDQEARKIWKKIKPLFLDEEMLKKSNDKEFLEKLEEVIEKALEKMEK